MFMFKFATPILMCNQPGLKYLILELHQPPQIQRLQPCAATPNMHSHLLFYNNFLHLCFYARTLNSLISLRGFPSRPVR